MKRKISILLLALFACLTIAACGVKGNGATSGSSNTESSNVESSESASESESNTESDTESDSANDSTSDSTSESGGGNVVTPIKPGGNYEW